mmetsp:Transcript_4251/g.11113  ORF Transcript_4251/g.11113 Transcript_4251/m.11113 type:complete len:84 (-) Transcript_4251:2776-3027(-)
MWKGIALIVIALAMLLTIPLSWVHGRLDLIKFAPPMLAFMIVHWIAMEIYLRQGDEDVSVVAGKEASTLGPDAAQHHTSKKIN